MSMETEVPKLESHLGRFGGNVEELALEASRSPANRHRIQAVLLILGFDDLGTPEGIDFLLEKYLPAGAESVG